MGKLHGLGCATIAAMLGPFKDPSLSQSMPALGVAGEPGGAAESRMPMRWGAWCLFVAAGVAMTLGIAWLGASLRPATARHRERPVDPALLAEGVRAFDSGDWKASVRAFERVIQLKPGHARALDYLDRIELTLEDADRLRLAEEALVAGQVFDAERFSLAVPPSSPLYAQAEAIARTAVEQRAQPPSVVAPGQDPTSAVTPTLDVKSALGEAVALYEAGRFADAAARAKALAEQATPETRENLLNWARDCLRFAQRYGQLPEDALNLVHHTRDAAEAIALDEHLSDGHYARKLREQTASALLQLARVLVDGGDILGGCERAREATEFDPRSVEVLAQLAGCAVEADRRVAQARAMASQRPGQALSLFRQALALSYRGSRAYRAAQVGIESLSWSEER